MDQSDLLVVRHRGRPIHVGVAHQREERVDPFGRKGLRQDVRNLIVAHCASLFPKKACRSHRIKARHKSLPPLSSAAGAALTCPSVGCDAAHSLSTLAGGALGSGVEGRASSVISFATFSANSARIARARCTPPAFAKVSSGPVT